MFDRAQLFFEDKDLAELREIFVRTCRALAIEGPHRANVREHVANVIMQVACSGESDPAVIELRVQRYFEATKNEPAPAGDETFQSVRGVRLTPAPWWLRRFAPA